LALNATTIIARNSLFRTLPEQTIAQITALATRRSYKADAVVFMRGDPGDALYGVVTGRVRISASGAGGKEVFLNIMEPGDAFGEIALLDGQPRTAAATTLAPTELMIIRREDFLALVKREPQLAVHLIELLCKRVRWTSEQMEDSSLLNVPARLAKRLLSLAASHGRKTPAGRKISRSFSGCRDRSSTSICRPGKSRAGSRSAAAASCSATSARCASSPGRIECPCVDSLRGSRSPSCAPPDGY
jgi:CRP/FNR family transcriptional regulator, cyclic AMP receptor protein